MLKRMQVARYMLGSNLAVSQEARCCLMGFSKFNRAVNDRQNNKAARPSSSLWLSK